MVNIQETFLLDDSNDDQPLNRGSQRFSGLSFVRSHSIPLLQNEFLMNTTDLDAPHSPDEELETLDTTDRKKARHEILVAKQTLKDILHHKPIDYELRDPFTLQVYKFYQTATYRKFLTLVIMIQLFTIFFEPARSSDKKDTVFIVYAFQLVCLLIHGKMNGETDRAGDLIGKYWFMGGRSFLMSGILFPNRHWNLLKCLITLYSILDVMMVFIFPEWFQFSRILRPFYLLESRHRLRQLTVNAIKTSIEVFPVIVLIFIWLTFYAALGFLMFGLNIPEFKTVPKAWLNLFVLITTANYPDVMTNAYEYNTWNFWYFFIFLIVGLFALQNVLIAVTYNTWRFKTSVDVRERILKRNSILNEVFDILSQFHAVSETVVTDQKNKIITSTVWHQLWAVLHPSYSSELVSDLMQIIKKTEDQGISRDDFMSIFSLLKLKVTQIPKRGNLSRTQQILEQVKQKIQVIFNARLLGYGVVDVIVVTSSVFLLILPSPIPPTYESDYNDLVVAIVYLLEVILKIYSFGWGEYWDKLVNKYDFLVTTIAFTLRIVSFVDYLSILDHYSNNQTNLLIRAILLFRVLRIFRGLRNFKSYQALFNTLIELPHFFSSFVVFIFCIYYVYAAIGMEVFSGKLRKSNPDLNGTLYAHDGYWKYNFDNFERSFVVLFYLMVVNNWYIIMDACAAVVNDWTRIYFISYYILVVWIFLNLVIAFLIEQFLSSYEKKIGYRTPSETEVLRFQQKLEEKGYGVRIRENLDTIQEDSLGG